MKFQYGNGDQPLEGFTILRGIGVGGFGEVYFAESDSGKEVALKRIQKNLDVEMRGVRHCLNLRHPNLVGIYDIRFDKEEQGWIVMEFIEGESLRDLLDRAPAGLRPDQLLPLFAQIVAGCTYLHDQGIVHRDLKPANIFIENALAKIGDYGLSKYISASRRGGQTESVGTFHYMAPEIGKGEYGKEIDIYSLGIILYEMLTGNVPFDGESSQEIILKHLTADPDLSMVPPAFARVVQRAMAKNPANRYCDGREMLADLGYAIDPSGMAVRSSIPAAPSEAMSQVAAPQGAAARPRVVYTKGASRQAIAGHETVWGEPRAGSVLSFGDRMGLFFKIGFKDHMEVIRHEPLAQQYMKFLQELRVWSTSAREGSPHDKGWWQNVFVILAVLGFVLMFSGLLTPLLIMVGSTYLIYYFAWFVGTGYVHCRAPGGLPLSGEPGDSSSDLADRPVRPNPAFQETAHFDPLESPRSRRPSRGGVPQVAKPISSKEALRAWQQEQRLSLGQHGIWARMHATVSSMVRAGCFGAISAVGGGFLMMSNAQIAHRDWLGGIAWLGIMATLASWVVIAFSRRWETRTEDSVSFRFMLMAAGLLLGAASFQVSEFLMIPWNKITSSEAVEIDMFEETFNRSWKGFYDADGMPVLAGHLAFFATLMWVVRWWRQSDILRKKRFSLWSILWSMILAGLVQGIFFFPGPWSVLLAGSISFLVQIASPWQEPSTSQASVMERHAS